jgi:hypothetical protein
VGYADGSSLLNVASLHSSLEETDRQRALAGLILAEWHARVNSERRISAPDSVFGKGLPDSGVRLTGANEHHPSLVVGIGPRLLPPMRDTCMDGTPFPMACYR